MDRGAQWASVHGDSPGKNTEVGCHFLLQGIFPTQGSKLGLQKKKLKKKETGSPALQADSSPSEPPGKPCTYAIGCSLLCWLLGFLTLPCALVFC